MGDELIWGPWSLWIRTRNIFHLKLINVKYIHDKEIKVSLAWTRPFKEKKLKFLTLR